MASLIKCRKCGGPHVTLKCGKETQNLDTVLENKFKTDNNNYNNYHNNHKTHNMGQRIDKRKIVVIKISNLPNDITVPELNELVGEWGKIGRINISNYDNTTCYIDFYFEDEALYFIKAIDKTPFENVILNVEIMKTSS
uniref:RRM domain-containing protein n=1 Tax=viral metagenome TaxID=1070528 RepID=A0A6C0HV19_9ZZZZ